MEDEFYIGYEKKSPKKTARFIILFVILVSVFILSFAMGNHSLREPFHAGVSSGKYVTLEGAFVAEPYPMLLAKRPGKTSKGNAISRYYVVPPGKKGLGKAAVKWNKKYVSVGGKLIYRENQTMFVINKGSLKENKSKKKLLKEILGKSYTKSLGTFTLRGEIVDSKCYLGQMKPGGGKTHRACATLCIRGGLPPLFVTKSPELSLNRTYLVLTSRSNQQVNQQVLDVVAEPVEIKGEVIKMDNLYFFKSDPKTYKRLSSI